MILYAIEYSGPITDDQWSIVTIHKSKESAEDYMDMYINNNPKNNLPLYRIKEINTFKDNDIIYDCYEEI